MNWSNSGKFSCVLFLGLTNAACGGGGGDPRQGDIIDRSGVTVGAISAFGSVILNGVKFDTDSADVVIDDVAGSESDLSVGQIVTVRGIVNGATGVATSITTDPIARGPIADIDLVAGSLVILQTRLDISSTTAFDQNIGAEGLDSLGLGDVVEAYGYPDASGNVLVTFVRRSTDSELELSGVISNLDANNSTFSIGAQLVDYAAASVVGAGGMALADGDLVEVEGDELDVDGRLVADRVEVELDQQFSAEDEGTELELEGLITSFSSSADFGIGAVAVTTNANTEYSGGTSTDLASDVFVEVEGSINSDGVLLADEVEFKQSSNLRLEAPIDSIDGSALTLLDLEFEITPTTQLIDNSAAMKRTFALVDLMLNDFVEIRAVGSNGQFSVNFLERQDAGGSSVLQGEVSSFSQPDLVVESISIASNAATAYQIGNSTVDVTEFFDELELDEEVRVVVDANNNGVLQATKMFLDF